MSARGAVRERVTIIPHPPPTTHRGAELESELEVELESELEIFSRPRAGVPLSRTKVRKLQAGNFVPLKIFSNLT